MLRAALTEAAGLLLVPSLLFHPGATPGLLEHAQTGLIPLLPGARDALLRRCKREIRVINLALVFSCQVLAVPRRSRPWLLPCPGHSGSAGLGHFHLPNAAEYLAQSVWWPSVAHGCCPRGAGTEDWQAITALTRQVMALVDRE